MHGSFILKYRDGVGSTTDNLDFDISALNLKVALEKLTTIGTVDVQRENMGNGHRWTITFLSNLGNLPHLSARKIKQEIQVISTTGGDPNPLAGYFSVTFGGHTTSDLSYDISESGMKAALEVLPSIGTVDVYRTGPSGNGQYSWKIHFRTEVGDLNMLTIDRQKCWVLMH